MADGGTVGIDVVGLERMRRLALRHPAEAAAALLGPWDARPADPAAIDGDLLAAALTAKEAWLKARRGRTDGWALPDLGDAPSPAGASAPSPVAGLSARARLMADCLAWDLEAYPASGGLHGPGSMDAPVWHARCGGWLVAAVIL
jgi:hypothetical protein